MGELAWCSGYIVDVSDGIKSKTSRWFSGKTSASRVYEKGLATNVEWDPVGSHEDSSVETGIRTKKVLGGCILSSK